MVRHAQDHFKNASIRLREPDKFNLRVWDGEAVAYNRDSGDLHYLDAACYRPLRELRKILARPEISSCPINELDSYSAETEESLYHAIAHLEKIGLVELLS